MDVYAKDRSEQSAGDQALVDIVGEFFQNKGVPELLDWSTAVEEVYFNYAVEIVPSQPPSSSPTSSSTNNSTLSDECEAIANGDEIEGQSDDAVLQEYDILLDVSLDDEADELEPITIELEEKIQKYLMPSLAGCPEEGRRLESTTAIVNALVDGRHDTNEACLAESESPCYRYVIALDLYVLNLAKSADFSTEIMAKFQDLPLVERLGLMLPYVQVTFVQVVARIPTASPSEQPTVNPSSNPTAAPTVASNPDTATPTAAPVASRPVPTSTPTKLPTLAPVVGPSPPPAKLPTPPPTKIPTESPSASPTSAPIIGPSPPPSPRPTKVPSASPAVMPSKSPTRTPSFRPTVQSSVNPTSIPTLVPSKVPTVKPSAVPSKTPTNIPSVLPTMTPTDRPTFAFDGQGVPVYGDWENQYSEYYRGVDVGMYFLFVPSDWQAVFGSFPSIGVMTLLNVEHRRNDEVIWQGEIAIWNLSGTRPDIGIPDGFESGRRHPISSALPGQWQTGDIIVPR